MRAFAIAAPLGACTVPPMRQHAAISVVIMACSLRPQGCQAFSGDST
jgi:hypothetical protein